MYRKLENLTLALTSSQAIGCNVVNVDAHSLLKGTRHLVLGLVWQIIRIGLFNQITLEHCPGLTTLLLEDEKIEDLMKLSPEAILLRWVNYHLERAGTARRVTNFQSDIVDSEVYSYLMKQIAPQDANVHTEALQVCCKILPKYAITNLCVYFRKGICTNELKLCSSRLLSSNAGRLLPLRML